MAIWDIGHVGGDRGLKRANFAILGHLAKYFGFGVALDIVITKYTLYLVEKRVFLAAGLSFIITLTNLLIYDKIITSKNAFWPSVAFALGCALGTYLVLIYP